jgi:hypothetical protein
MQIAPTRYRKLAPTSYEIAPTIEETIAPTSIQIAPTIVLVAPTMISY